MSILVHRATDEIDRLEMFALAKSEEGQSVLIARIEHLESVLKETKGYLIESKVKIKELEQDLENLKEENDELERALGLCMEFRQKSPPGRGLKCHEGICKCRRASLLQGQARPLSQMWEGSLK
jgi:hypothetical protein